MIVQEKSTLANNQGRKKMPFYPETWVKREKKAANSHLSSKPLVISEGQKNVHRNLCSECNKDSQACPTLRLLCSRHFGEGKV